MTVMNNYCYIQPTITAETYLTCSSGTDFNGNPTDLTRGVLDFGVTYCERDMFSEGKLDRDCIKQSTKDPLKQNFRTQPPLGISWYPRESTKFIVSKICFAYLEFKGLGYLTVAKSSVYYHDRYTIFTAKIGIYSNLWVWLTILTALVAKLFQIICCVYSSIFFTLGHLFRAELT